jgi:hypothetical protein
LFDLKQAAWSYRAEVPAILRSTALPLPAKAAEAASASLCHAPRSAAYWAKAMAGLNFAVEDHLDTALYNQALWTGMTGKPDVPQPTGEDLSGDRAERLAAAVCR